MNVRKLCVRILDEVFGKKAYSNIILNREIKKNKIEDKDIGLLTEIVYGTIKYKYTIDIIINNLSNNRLESIDPHILNILRISIYQLKYLDKVPDYAVLNEAVNLSKSKSVPASKFVNAILRSFLRADKDIKVNFRDEVSKLAFQYSFEKWMVELFIKEYGMDKTILILSGLNSIPKVTVRVNNLISSYDEVYEELENNDYNIEEGSISPEAIIIKNGKSIEKNIVFNQGKITVQDESAMLTSECLDIGRNQVILDLCSAPGGKATHMAEIAEDQSIINAFDIHEHKIKLIEENAERLKIKNIKTKIMDATLLNETLINSADRILADVPCSGLGIIRKKPEIKWFKSKKDLNTLVDIQRKIMLNASYYLKSDGVMVYSTCTLNKKENEENVRWFLDNNKNFYLEKIYFGDKENIIYHKEGYITILPDENMDGFFIAKLRKM